MAVPHTALLAFARAGYRVRLAHPEGFDLDPEVVRRAEELAGDRLTFHREMEEGVSGASVIYAKSWGSQAEHGGAGGDRAVHLREWIVDQTRQSLADPGAFMHCLPVRRNVVVTDEVIDGPHSWVAEQARSRVPVQAAVLHEVMEVS
jgi:N-acetylornithine carbamoyltransferase